MGKKRGRPTKYKNEADRAKNIKYRPRTVNIGPELTRWKHIRDNFSLTDPQFAKVMLDCLEDEAPNLSLDEHKQAKRTVGTQSKLSHGRMSSETQTGLTCKDLDSLRNAFDKHLAKEMMETESSTRASEKGEDFTRDTRWQALMESLGCAADGDLAKTLMDWFVDTMPLMQLTGTRQTPTEMEAADRPRRRSKPYLLTFCVTSEQEQAIQAMCVLKGWPYGPLADEKLAPVQVIDDSPAEYDSHLDHVPLEPRPITSTKPAMPATAVTTTPPDTDEPRFLPLTDNPISDIQAQLSLESSGYQTKGPAYEGMSTSSESYPRNRTSTLEASTASVANAGGLQTPGVLDEVIKREDNIRPHFSSAQHSQRPETSGFNLAERPLSENKEMLRGTDRHWARASYHGYTEMESGDG